ncbi:chondroitin AC/alginate lyase [Cytidiella melzeri]|nr:chondroitin AC/alginate lyase [Cytidiella melzeri]
MAATYNHSLANYADVFVDPTYALSKNFSDTTVYSQQTILRWADDSAQGGPWSVTTKPYLTPSGDKHDYMSWAPYAWPDCSSVGNTTELTPQQIWTTCPYVTKDGQFNPDNSDIMNADDFDSLSNAVLYNGLSWAITGSSTYSSRVATYIRAWFLDPDTYMNPNLNYAQMQRGPAGQNGDHVGVLDLKSMAKIATGVLVLRNGKATEWTSDIDTQFGTWIKNYISWLQSSPISLKEKAATNNHGSYFFTQLAALQAMVGDTAGAQGTINEYFGRIYLNQIASNGDQPLESSRTRPFHYRAYNLAAIITIARIGDFVGLDVWSKPASSGATISSALTFAMSTEATDDTEAQELYPIVAAVASRLGDPETKYVEYLSQKDGGRFVTDPTFFWSQPLSDRGYVALMNRTGSASSAASGATATTRKTGGKSSGGNVSSNGGVYGAVVGLGNVLAMVVGAALVVSSAMLF